MKKSRNIALVLIGILIGVAAVVFVLSNKQPVVLKFWRFETVPMWMSLTVLASVGAGVLIVLIYTFYLWMKLRGQIRRLTRKNQALEAELMTFRNQPLDDPDPLVADGGAYDAPKSDD